MIHNNGCFLKGYMGGGVFSKDIHRIVDNFGWMDVGLTAETCMIISAASESPTSLAYCACLLDYGGAAALH